MKREKITVEESKLAIAAQSPVDENKQSLAGLTSFKQLAKASTSGRVLFGGNGQWIKADDLFSYDYKDGLESPPFVVTKAFRYVSKGTNRERFGVEIVMANKRCYNVGMPFNENDSKRVAILDFFANKTGSLIGPLCLVKLDLGKGNPYYDFVPYESGATESSPEIPFSDVDFDSEIPF